MSLVMGGDTGKKIANPPTPVPTPPSVWTSQSDNKLAAPDALNILGNMEFISEFQKGGAAGLLGNAMSMLKGGSSVFGKIDQAMGFVGQVQSILQGNGNILDRVGALSGMAGGALSSFGLDPNNSILKGVGSLGNLAMNIDGVVQNIKNTNFKDVNSLLALASGITGNTGFMKLAEYATQAQYMVGMVKGFLNANIPNSFGMFKDIIRNNPLKNQIVKDTYHTVVKKQDLSSINAMVDVVGRDQFNRIVNSGTDLESEEASRIAGVSYYTTTGFTNILATNWNKGEETLGTSDEKNFDQIYSTIKTVNGDDWLYTERNGIPTINGKDFTTASDRFQELMKVGFTKSNRLKITNDPSLNIELSSTIKANETTKKDDEKFLLASRSTSNSVLGSLKKQFPYTYISNNNVTI